LNTPAGLVAGAKAGGEDLASAGGAFGHAIGSKHAHGDLSFKRSRAMGKAMVKQTAADLRHPLRHPGFTLLDVMAVASAGAGAGSRLAGAGRALRAGDGLRAAVTRPGYQGGSLLHKRAPGETEL